MSKVTPGLAKKKNSIEIRIYMTFNELVDAQKQFSELAGHFLLKGEVIFYIPKQNILTVQSHPEKKFPNLPIFNYFTACYVCLIRYTYTTYNLLALKLQSVRYTYTTCLQALKL